MENKMFIEKQSIELIEKEKEQIKTVFASFFLSLYKKLDINDKEQWLDNTINKHFDNQIDNFLILKSNDNVEGFTSYIKYDDFIHIRQVAVNVDLSWKQNIIKILKELGTRNEKLCMRGVIRKENKEGIELYKMMGAQETNKWMDKDYDEKSYIALEIAPIYSSKY